MKQTDFLFKFVHRKARINPVMSVLIKLYCFLFLMYYINGKVRNCLHMFLHNRFIKKLNKM